MACQKKKKAEKNLIMPKLLIHAKMASVKEGGNQMKKSTLDVQKAWNTGISGSSGISVKT